MGTKIFGDMSLGFAGGVGLILLTWAITFAYVRRSDRVWGPLEERIRAEFGHGAGARGALQQGRGAHRGPGAAVTVLAIADGVNALALVVFAIVLAITLLITYWASKRTHSATEFWAAEPRHLQPAERLRDRRRLPVGVHVPGLRRAHLPVRRRRLGRPGRGGRVLPARRAAARRAHAQRRQVHDGRRPVLPPARATRPDRRGAGDARRLVRLPHRADGRRGGAAPGARGPGLHDRGRRSRASSCSSTSSSAGCSPRRGCRSSRRAC